MQRPLRARQEAARSQIRRVDRRRRARYTGYILNEYTVLGAVVVAALLSMQVYLKRGIAGKIRTSAATIGEQYDPRNTTGLSLTAVTSDTNTVILTFNEPELSDFFDNCTDVNLDGDCTDTDVFATVAVARLRGEQTDRASTEQVGPLPDTIWDDGAAAP